MVEPSAQTDPNAAMSIAERRDAGNVLGLCLLGLLLFGSLKPGTSGLGLASAVTPTDVIAGAAVGIGVLHMVQYRNRTIPKLVSHLLAILAFYTALTIIAVLLHGDGGAEGIKGVAAMLYCLTPVVLCLMPNAPSNTRPLDYLYFAGVAVFLLTTIADLATQSAPNTRDAAIGLFSDPNHTASWAAMALLVLVFHRFLPIWIRVILALGLALVILVTFSFSTVLGLAAAGLFWATRGRRRGVPTLLVFSALSSLLAIHLARVEALLPRFSQDDALGKSSAPRFQFWREAMDAFANNPLGLGPDGVQAALQGREVHNEYLFSLAAYSLPGLAFILIVGVTIWRFGGDSSRASVLFVAVVAVFHQPISWRHVWVFFAVCLVYDAVRGQSALRLVERSATPAIAAPME